jgi:hypothetical protein
MKKIQFILGLLLLSLSINAQAYLPITGGTLTGTLIGTNATFLNDIKIGSYDGASHFYDAWFSGISQNSGYKIGGQKILWMNTSSSDINIGRDDIIMSLNSDNKSAVFNGNVGIGTSAPASLLHIKNGSIMASDIDFNVINVRMDGTNVPALKFTRWTGSGSLQHNAFIGQFYNSDLGEYSFGIGTGISATGDQNATSNVITAKLDGNVGIGTTNPTEKLEVNGVIKSNNGTIGSGGGYWQGLYSPASTGVWSVNQNNRAFFGLGGNIYSKGFSDNAMGIMNGSIIAEDIFLYNSNSPNAGYLVLKANNNVGIGTSSPTEKLSVNGNIRSKKIIVTQNGWSDYVFNDGYHLRPLSQVENFIKENKHLPEVPTAKDVEKNGIDLGETQALLLKKIEELTLYIIELKKQNDVLQKKVEEHESLLIQKKLK